MKHIASFIFAALLFTQAFSRQESRQLVRLARIVVDSTQLEQYKAILKEEAETSVRIEPGVLTLFAVQEKNKPTHFTILEIYADSAAYKAHLQSPHFLKYKTGTKDMVKSLELIEATPLIPDMKIKVDSAALKRKKYQAKAPATISFGKEAFTKSNTTTARWLGMAGFLINSRGTTLMIDPLLRDFDMPLLIDFPISSKNVPRLDAVLITHSDNDHYSVPTNRDLRAVTKQTQIHYCFLQK